MNIKKTLILVSIFLSLTSIYTNVNAKETTIEWAPFIKISSITDKRLIKIADAVNSDFLIQQKGFIKRELVKKSDNEYADVVYWESKTDAISAGNKVNACIVCGEYFQLMEMDKKAGEGFSHYVILKSWKR